MDAAILAKFEEAVALFSIGNHLAATGALAAVQQAPSSQLVPLMMQHAILAGGGGSDLLALALDLFNNGGSHQQLFSSGAEAFAFVVQKHFYAFRLISHGVTGDYVAVWRSQFDSILQTVEQYLTLNTGILTGGSSTSSSSAAAVGLTPQLMARTAKALSSEISSLWAVLWKLEICAVTSGVEAGNINTGTDAALFARLSDRLTSMLYMSPSLALEPILTNLVVSACEEFGLTHKASRQRGISMATQELVRSGFTSAVLPSVASAGFASLNKCVKRGIESVRGNAVMSPEAVMNYAALAATARLLCVVFSWRMATCDVRSTFFVSSFAAQASTSAPEVIPLQDARWRDVLEAGTDGSSSSSPMAVFATLLDAVTLISAVNRQAQSSATALGINTEMMEGALADFLTAFVQVCSIDAEFWDGDAKGHFASCAWAASLRLCDPTVSGGRPEVVAGACLAMQRVLSINSALAVVLASPSAVGSFIHPLANTTTTMIALISEAEAASANAFLARQNKAVSSYTSSNLVSFDGDDGANGACDILLEGLDHLLRAWQNLVREGTEDMSVRVTIPDATIAAIGSGAAEVLKVFVNTKVQLHSSQSLLAEDGSEAPESSHAIEYANSNTELIALIARENASDVCDFLLSQLTNLSTLYMESYAKAGRECPMALNEALWYVITVIGEYIASKPDSERPSIPQTFINLAIRCERQWPNDVPAQITHNKLFSLCGAVFFLCESLLEPVLRGVVSPGVCQALLDVLARYANTYLLPDPLNQSERAEAFEVAFSSGTDAAKVILSFLAVCLKVYGADPDVAKSATVVFQSLLRLPKEFSQWVLSDAGSGLPPMLAAGAGGVANWFDFYSQCALGGVLQLSSALRAKTIGFLLSVASYASIDALEALADGGGGGDDGGFGCFSSGGKTALTAEMARTTVVGRFVAHVCGVLESEVRRSAACSASSGTLIAALECIGGLVEGLGLPLAVTAANLCGLTPLVIVAAEAAVASHRSAGARSDRMALIAATSMVDRVLVDVGCFFETSAYVLIVHAALSLTLHIGETVRAVAAVKNSRQNGDSDIGTSDMLADGNDTVELITSCSKMVLNIATWGSMDYSMSATNNADHARNELVARVSVEGLSVALSFLDETTALIPELRDEIFRLMKTVTGTYAGSMIALMSAESSAALLQTLNFAFNSGVPDLVEGGCSVVQSFATYEIEERSKSPSSSSSAVTSLLGSFLHRIASLILFVPVDPSVTSSIGATLLELVRALGYDAATQSFKSELATASASAAFSPEASVSLMSALDSFFSTAQSLDISRPRRDVRLRFCAEVDKLITVIQGARRLMA